MTRIGDSKSTNLVFLFLIGCVGILGGIASSFWGLSAWLSFEAGFVGFVSVVMSSFVAIIKYIQVQESQSVSQLESESKQATEQANDGDSKQSAKPPKYSKFIMGTQVSFSFLRLLSYGFFALALVGLMHYGMLHFGGLFAGMILAMILLIGLGVYVFYAKH